MSVDPYLKHHFGLEGQKALVTGGASGIGQAIAIALAKAGADVGITVHSRSGDETLAMIKRAGRSGLSIATDLAALDAAGADLLIGKAESEFGPVSILVNNAGIIRRDNFYEHQQNDWRDVMAANLDAVWYLSQAVGKRMRERRNGRIINIASLLSFQGGIRVPGYTAAKHAVAGLTKAMANELAPFGVTVNAIAPGYVATENTKALRADPDRSRQILERIPAGRWAEPSDLASAAIFLCAPASGYVTGQILAVDGGWLAR
ncbi:MAG: SDR family oxidoreductase [Rhizobiaceae bacterium]